MKLRTKIQYIYIDLFILLPIIDSINGLINGGGNESGLSLGIVYRIVIMAFCAYFLSTYHWSSKNAIRVLSIVAYIAIMIAATIFHGNMLTLMFKLLLPILIIESNRVLLKNQKINLKSIESVFDKWIWLFPITIIAPYLLGIGYSTYGIGQAGFKGFYYAQNDIGYCLFLCFFYCLIKLASNRSMITIACLGLNLACNLILGLKSNYIMILISLLYVFFSYTKRNGKLWKLISIVIVAAAIAIGLRVYQQEIKSIIARWQYFSDANGFVSLFFSTRNERIIPGYRYVITHPQYLGIIWGTGLGYTSAIPKFAFVEMDFFDVLFQLGIIGVFLIYGYYFGLYRKTKTSLFKDKYKIMFIFSIVISSLAGHVLETALSGMFFSMVCTSLASESIRKVGIYGGESFKG